MSLYALPGRWASVPDDVERQAANVRAVFDRYYGWGSGPEFDQAGVFLLEQALRTYRDTRSSPAQRRRAADAVELLALFVGADQVAQPPTMREL